MKDVIESLELEIEELKLKAKDTEDRTWNAAVEWVRHNLGYGDAEWLDESRKDALEKK